MVVLSRQVTLCRSLWKKATGLMFHKKKEDFAYVFEFSSPRIIVVTMWFVFFPIDILFIKDGIIVEIARHVRPFTHYVAQKSDTFIELPVGSAEESYIGEKVTWNSSIVEIADK